MPLLNRNNTLWSDVNRIGSRINFCMCFVKCSIVELNLNNSIEFELDGLFFKWFLISPTRYYAPLVLHMSIDYNHLRIYSIQSWWYILCTGTFPVKVVTSQVQNFVKNLSFVLCPRSLGPGPCRIGVYGILLALPYYKPQ